MHHHAPYHWASVAFACTQPYLRLWQLAGSMQALLVHAFMHVQRPSPPPVAAQQACNTHAGTHARTNSNHNGVITLMMDRLQVAAGRRRGPSACCRWLLPCVVRTLLHDACWIRNTSVQITCWSCRLMA